MTTPQQRVAIITGAGSTHGIGFAAARLLGASGKRVVITSTTDRIFERVAELRDAGIRRKEWSPTSPIRPVWTRS